MGRPAVLPDVHRAHDRSTLPSRDGTMIRIAVVDEDAVLLDLYSAVFHQRGWAMLRCDELAGAVEALLTRHDRARR